MKAGFAEAEFMREEWGDCEFGCPFMTMRGPMENPTSYCDRALRDRTGRDADGRRGGDGRLHCFFVEEQEGQA
jgi:hypothetical protein